jgi:hypothetical protein
MLVRIPIDDRIILNGWLEVGTANVSVVADAVVDHFLDVVALGFPAGLNVGPGPSDVIWCHGKGFVTPPFHCNELDATPGGVGNRLNADTSPDGEVIRVV